MQHGNFYQQDYVGHGLITKNKQDFSAWNAVQIDFDIYNYIDLPS